MPLRRSVRPISGLAVRFACVVVIATPAIANPVITEVAWGGDPTTNSGTDEWIEIYNPDPQPIDLAGFTLLGAGSGTAAIALPAVTLADGAFFFVQNTAGVPSSDAARTLVVGGLSLTDSGELLCLCPTGTATCDGTCDIASPAAAAWFAGQSTSGNRKTMERKDVALGGGLASSWQDGNPASPDALSPVQVVDAGPDPVDDAGPDPVDDAGPQPVVDAGPNEAPTIAVTEPSGTASGSAVNVVYSANDTDVDDAVSVDLYWSLDGEGQDGTRFARGLPGGVGQVATFDTTGVPPGTVHVFAVARDTRGAISYAYAPGVVDVQGGGAAEAELEVKEPDGINDVDAEGALNITWELALPAGATGTLTLFLDEDDDGEDGEPLVGGLPTGPDAQRAYRLPLTDLEPGEYFVYGVLDYVSPEGPGRVSSYAPASFQVSAGGCACTDKGETRGPRLLAVATLAILLLPFVRRTPSRRTPARRRA